MTSRAAAARRFAGMTVGKEVAEPAQAQDDM
jgi:hypothetical protein